ncbi:hypothetical protein OSH11_13765 [Kaistia dalseonensis]|uniref:Uncharacterized protein n=1 Tax=Kaistia dalseonensis TaxID=410840 RepID=A0ABU0H7V1_9HYPH|nr:hypothetical protein [Kaistia dalseonensis]MCX5495776.1 hypothetical protein [Kaistia dalseonensis]MDQ0438376.1 hypothetical protein [Kaistia dalseonensis]
MSDRAALPNPSDILLKLFTAELLEPARSHRVIRIDDLVEFALRGRSVIARGHVRAFPEEGLATVRLNSIGSFVVPTSRLTVLIPGPSGVR